MHPFIARTIQICIFALNIAGQAIQNICLPLALSGNEDMAVVFMYTTFVYFVFFSILDVVTDVVSHDEIAFSRVYMAAFVGFPNALNGIGAIFGGSSTRTPLPIQMMISLVVNSMSCFYKIALFRIPPRYFVDKRSLYYVAAIFLYVVAFALIVVDKFINTSGVFSWFCIFFVAGTFFGMSYNIHQEHMLANKVDMAALTNFQAFKMSIKLLRQQNTWLFIFSWIAVPLALIPTVDQGGVLTADTFFRTWGTFLKFDNVYMNLFNAGYIVSFITSVFINRYDSSFNMITSNVSAVLSLWTGWIPSISMQTTGYVPTVWLTVPAMIIALIAIVPSYLCSVFMADVVKKHTTARADESIPLKSINTIEENC